MSKKKGEIAEQETGGEDAVKVDDSEVSGAVPEAKDGLGPESPKEASGGEVPAYLKPDYTGPLTVEQAIERRWHITK